MAYRLRAAAFQQIDEPQHVAFHIGLRVFQRIAHSGLRSQVDDHIKVMASEKSKQTFPIFQIQL